MPTTTNLGIVTPASSDYVTNGAVAMQTMADDIDAYFGAPSTYTPTTTNVSGGAVTGRYIKMGNLGIVHINLSAGTATAAGSVSFSLPSGWTAISFAQVVPARNSNSLITAQTASPWTSITVWADEDGTNWGLGASLTGIRLNGWLFLA